MKNLSFELLSNFSLGIFVVFTENDYSTPLFDDDTVIITSSFTLSCYIGSMENFSHYEFSFLQRDLDTYTLSRNGTSHSLHLHFTQFDNLDNGYYTCRGYPGVDQTIAVSLISFRSGKFFINIYTNILSITLHKLSGQKYSSAQFTLIYNLLRFIGTRLFQASCPN